MNYVYNVLAGKYSAEDILCCFFTEEEADEFSKRLDFIITKVVKTPILGPAMPVVTTTGVTMSMSNPGVTVTEEA